LSPFASLDQVIKAHPDALQELTKDIVHGDATNPHSVAYLIMKRKFLNSVGRDKESRQVSHAIQELCRQEAPSPLCRQQAM